MRITVGARAVDYERKSVLAATQPFDITQPPAYEYIMIGQRHLAPDHPAADIDGAHDRRRPKLQIKAFGNIKTIHGLTGAADTACRTACHMVENPPSSCFNFSF